ncbi:hypothetical protein KIK06_24900 [Nocardiopsis sp. EMB25]|uniref:hypothetical protein n=1 Tax=Nocardiopsis sp. EMB25 TaxID=2835867 RepID=UPI0022845913|nr:hypothetical protein [Nocardiopsis sp. EMB25]MCY9787128.1 hypothetical protein [Nocardiopsis sp. EMB25]
MSPPQTSTPRVVYLGHCTWLIDGHRGHWGASYRYLTRDCGFYHSQANRTLVQAMLANRLPEEVSGGRSAASSLSTTEQDAALG